MKRFLILFPLALLAADVTDLGLLNDRQMIPLEKCRRYGTAFSWFEIEAIQARPTGTNRYHLKTTNEFLVLSDFITASVPDGHTQLFIRERCGDGSVSPYSEATVKLTREPPSKPRFGKPVQILAQHTEQKIEDVLKAKAAAEALIVPPMPPGMSNILPQFVSPVPLRYRTEALPSGTNTGYSDRRRSQ